MQRTWVLRLLRTQPHSCHRRRSVWPCGWHGMLQCTQPPSVAHCSLTALYVICNRLIALPASTDLQDKLPKVDMAEDGGEKVKITDFVHSSSGMLLEKSSINFLPCSTDLRASFRRWRWALSQKTLISHSVVKTVNITEFGSLGMPTEESSIDFLPYYTPACNQKMLISHRVLKTIDGEIVYRFPPMLLRSS